MNIYYHLLENPLFYKWIYHPSEELNSYWEQFLELNPEDAELILDFKSKFEKHLQFQNDQLSELEKKTLARQILQRIEVEKHKKNRFKAIRQTIRYAAIAILFLTMGGTISYFAFNYKPTNQFSTFPLPQNLNIYEPTLILDSNTEIALNNGNSELKYSEKGEITLNNKKVLEQETDGTVRMNTLVIPYGNSSTITLSDGTMVWLNAGSRLIYPSHFVDKTREVLLVGEAFFKIAKNEEKPFLVNTPDLKLKVLGTQFNVSAYPDDNIVQTVLTEGSVELSAVNSGFFDRPIEMKPGELVTYNKLNKETNSYQVQTSYYTSWKEGYLTFYNTDLSRIVKKLERYYNIRIRYNDPLNGSIKISGKLDITKEQEVVFEYMNSLTGLEFKKFNKTIYVIN